MMPVIKWKYTVGDYVGLHYSKGKQGDLFDGRIKKVKKQDLTPDSTLLSQHTILLTISLHDGFRAGHEIEQRAAFLPGGQPHR